MLSMEQIYAIALSAIVVFLLIRFLKKLLAKSQKKFARKGSGPSKRRVALLSAKTRAKADRKYAMLLAEFNRMHKRKPSKNDLIRVVITASHHTFPVKGKNVRKWTKGKRGHWNRQKVRKYLLEKHNIVENFKMQ